jgi:NADH-quinone oxidoreductase subunit I
MFDSVKGFWVTLKHFFQKPITYKYPMERRSMGKRYRGVPVFVPDEQTGESKCTGCGLCARVCPSEVITVERIKKPAPAPVTDESGERCEPTAKPKDEVKYSMNIARCIYCGYCVDACAVNALAMSNEYELSAPNREDLIYNKDHMLELGKKYVNETAEQDKEDKEKVA